MQIRLIWIESLSEGKSRLGFRIIVHIVDSHLDRKRFMIVIEWCIEQTDEKL